MKKSKVYFVPATTGRHNDRVSALSKLLEAAGPLFKRIKGKTAVKIHFGEEANKGYVHPELAAMICHSIKSASGQPFLCDTNTLYKGRRTISAEHLKLAYEHGFTPDKTGVEVIIPDDNVPSNVATVELNQKYIKSAKVAALCLESDSLVGIAHFKGHIMTGFGGALKNIGMGCASREGKLAQHCQVAPVIYRDNCTGCAACVQICPSGAISLRDKKASMQSAKCIGCASCIAACKFFAIDIPWESGSGCIQEKMIEYAKAVIDKHHLSSLFFNFAYKVTKECDCLAKDDPCIAPDCGILCSQDPVSLDKASFDLVNEKSARDVFREAHPERDGLIQLRYAAELGLGNLEYELIEV